MNPHPLVQKPRPLQQPTLAFVATATLYVGDLDPETTELDVADAFFHVVPFASLKLCRNRLTHNSLCYAYVNFFSLSDAAWAMSCLNHTYLRGKRIRIMWSQKDPTIRKTGIGNLFVNNIHPSITTAGLHGLFSQFGAILSCKITEEDGKSEGFGYVQFASEFSALSALSALNGTFIQGMMLSVSKFVKKGDRMESPGPEPFSNLYVKNLDDDVTEDQLKRMFQAHGKVCNVSIVNDEAQKSRGYGLVQFASDEEVKKAMDALNGSRIGPKVLFVERTLVAERKEALETAQPLMCNYQPQKCSKVYVGNLDASIDASDLELIFHAYGKITSTKVINYPNGVSRGFGFVCFCSREEAKEAIDSVNGTNIRGRSLIVECETGTSFPAQWCLVPINYDGKWEKTGGFWTYDALCNRQEWNRAVPLEIQNVVVHPPIMKNKAGRPKNKRILSQGEDPVKSEYLSTSEHSSQRPIDMKTYQTWKIKGIHDSAGASSKGSKENKPLFAASSTELFNKYSDKLIQPSNQSIQAEHENITGMLMGAGNYNIQNSKSSQTFQVKVEKGL